MNGTVTFAEGMTNLVRWCQSSREIAYSTDRSIFYGFFRGFFSPWSPCLPLGFLFLLLVRCSPRGESAMSRVLDALTHPIWA